MKLLNTNFSMFNDVRLRLNFWWWILSSWWRALFSFVRDGSLELNSFKIKYLIFTLIKYNSIILYYIYNQWEFKKMFKILCAIYESSIKLNILFSRTVSIELLYRFTAFIYWLTYYNKTFRKGTYICVELVH